MIEYSDVVNTFLLLIKRFSFLLLHENIIFFGYTSRYFVYRVRSSTTLWLPYCSFRSSCKITAIVGLFERLLLRTAVHSFIHHHYHFFYLIRFDAFLHLHHQFLFWWFFIRFTRWPKIRLSEDLSLKQAYHNAMKHVSIVQF